MTGPRPQHVRVVPGKDGEALFAKAAKALGGAELSGEVGGEGGEARVVENVREMGDVGADHDLSDPDRLVPGAVPGRAQELDRAVAEQIVIAVDEDDLPILVGVVARLEIVELDPGLVVSGLPFGPLDHDRDALGHQREAAGMVEVKVGENDPGQEARSTCSAIDRSCSNSKTASVSSP